MVFKGSNNDFSWGKTKSAFGNGNESQRSAFDGFGNPVDGVSSQKITFGSGSNDKNSGDSSFVFGNGNERGALGSIHKKKSENSGSVFGDSKNSHNSTGFGTGQGSSVGFGAAFNAPSKSRDKSGGKQGGAEAAPFFAAPSASANPFGCAQPKANLFGCDAAASGFESQLIRVPLRTYTELKLAVCSARERAERIAAQHALAEQKLRGLVITLHRLSNSAPEPHQALARWLDDAGVSVREAERWSGGALRASNWAHARARFAALEAENRRLSAELRAAKGLPPAVAAKKSAGAGSGGTDSNAATHSEAIARAHEAAIIEAAGFIAGAAGPQPL